MKTAKLFEYIAHMGAAAAKKSTQRSCVFVAHQPKVPASVLAMKKQGK